jgi:hypothetical protein
MPGQQSQRDARIDILRGLSLVTIFVDHIPGDQINLFTVHNFGFCDAGEIFVLLAGFASMKAYGRAFERDGAAKGLRRVLLRCAQIYGFQIALLLATLGIVQAWTSQFDLAPGPVVGAVLQGGLHSVKLGLTLRLLPTYLDILPLYVVLLAIFPVIYYAMRRSLVAALLASAALWLVVQFNPAFDLPNVLDAKGVWYFNPFAWQFIFTAGAALAVVMTGREDVLPRRGWLMAACWGFLAFALVESAPWKDWGLPDLRLLAMAPPDKSTLAPLRLVDVAALFYLLLSSRGIAALARTRALWWLEVCGKHSLQVFSLGCLLALIARLGERTFGSGVVMQIMVNVVGLGAMVALASWLEGQRHGGRLREIRSSAAP